MRKQLNNNQPFTLEDLAYELPEELIAQSPSPVRHQSRLLAVDRVSGELHHHCFENIKQLLRPGDVLVVNDTRVVPSRVFAQRKSGGIVRFLLLRPVGGTGNGQQWEAMVTPIKRLHIGETLSLIGPAINRSNQPYKYELKISDLLLDQDGYKRLIVDLGEQENAFRILSRIGFAPLPPYIVRKKPEGTIDNTNGGGVESGRNSDDTMDGNAEAKATNQSDAVDGHAAFKSTRTDTMDGNPINENTNWADATTADDSKRLADLERYQTVFAAHPGAVAAPTAGLHFSEQLLNEIRDNGIELKTITLHVGPGTFKPISTDIDSHNIEPERFIIPEETAVAVNHAKTNERRVIAVGTTTLRALETAGTSGRLISPGLEQTTSLYVKPGFGFKIVDALITNFHLSKSSLLVLVATLAGKELILKAYEEAVRERYRFFSYGDAMFIT